MSNITDALPISKKDIMSLLNAFIPKGMIAWFALTAAPEGWAICDGTNGTPNLIGRYPLGATSDIGGLVEAGLPNIGGTFQGTGYATGAFTVGNAYIAQCNDGDYWDKMDMTFDASKGTIEKINDDGTVTYMAQEDSPYGKSNTVTPPSVKLLPCMKL